MLARGNVNRRKVKILIVDDHPIVRQGIMQVCDHDLAIVDISLNGVSGFELINTLKRRYAELAILVMSMHDESVHAERRAHSHSLTRNAGWARVLFISTQAV